MLAKKEKPDTAPRKIEITIGDRNFIYIDHSELHSRVKRSSLLTQAREVLAKSDGTRRASNGTVAFKALHAVLRELHMRQNRGCRLSTYKPLVQLYDEINDYLFRQNLGLVYDMRRRSPVRGVDPADVLSEGQWALFRAIRSFDPWKGFRFSTYACSSILHAFRYLAIKRRRDLRKVADMYRNRADRYETEAPRSADRDLDVDVSIERIRRVLIENQAHLTTAERLIINERVLTRGDERPATLESIGRLLDLSKERVRQLQFIAIDKLRRVVLSTADREPWASRPRRGFNGAAA